MMLFTIYMLKDGRDDNLFMSYDWAMAHGGVNVSDYEAVYTGSVEPKEKVAETLEAIYTMFNLDHPAGYRGRSLSVSDLVALEDTGTYFVDSIGFRKINQPTAPEVTRAEKEGTP